MKRFALILALMTSGCAIHRQYFRPAEREHGTTMQGYPEAMYALVGPQGQFGEAKLWSRGSYRGPNGETLIHLAVELHNTSAQRLTLPAAQLRLETVDTELGALGNVPPRNPRDREVAPGAIRELGAEFELPARVAPGEIRGFIVRWTVHGGNQSYSQRTPFVVEYRARYYGSPYVSIYGHYGYYACDPLDPFCPYRYGYYGPYGPPYYHPPSVVVPGPPHRGGVIVRPRR